MWWKASSSAFSVKDHPRGNRFRFSSNVPSATTSLAVFRSYRRRAFQRYGVAGSKCGAVVFVQRFGGALNLNVHFHALVLEGAYEVPPSNNQVRFLPLPAPTEDDVREVMADAARRISRQLASRRRLGANDDQSYDPEQPSDRLAREDPLLARLYACSVEGRVPTGRRAGLQSERQGAVGPKAAKQKSPPPLCAVGHGLSLHAGVYIPGSDRERLERVCRYTGRSPLAVDRLSMLDDGRIKYRLRHPWRDGTTHVVFEPAEFMARLASLIPAPRGHQVRYYGILAPAAAWRDQVVPNAKPSQAPREASVDTAQHSTAARPGRRPWAELLGRVFALDVLECPRCGGRTRVMAVALHEPFARALLARLAQSGRAPPWPSTSAAGCSTRRGP